MIKSILENDLYKFSQTFYYQMLYPEATGTFTFKDRNNLTYDNGYLTDPETQSLINAYMNPDSYRDLYAIMLMSGWNYSSPRMIRLELTYQF